MATSSQTSGTSFVEKFYKFFFQVTLFSYTASSVSDIKESARTIRFAHQRRYSEVSESCRNSSSELLQPQTVPRYQRQPKISV